MTTSVHFMDLHCRSFNGLEVTNGGGGGGGGGGQEQEQSPG